MKNQITAMRKDIDETSAAIQTELESFYKQEPLRESIPVKRKESNVVSGTKRLKQATLPIL